MFPRAELPKDKPVFDLVRESCAQLVESSKDVVTIDDAALTQWANTVDLATIRNTSFYGFPMRFETLNDEINFYAVLDLLNFGSGYRHLLKKHAKRGAFETICYGMMGMHMTNALDAEFMSKIRLVDVSQMFSIPLDVEVEIQPAIYASKDHPLKPLAQKITKVLNDSGAILRNLQYDSFAQFIYDQPNGRPQKRETPLTAEELVRRLVTHFPAFNDHFQHGEVTVRLFKKAQLLVADLWKRFRQRDPVFNFPDIAKLTVFSDNVLPAVLRELGILKLAPALLETIQQQTPLPPGREEAALRAAAVIACERLLPLIAARESSAPTAEAKSTEAKQPASGSSGSDTATASAESTEPITSSHLDYYLWNLGKDEKFRSAERHYTPDTVYY